MQGPCLIEEAAARPWGIYLSEFSGPGYGIAWSPRLALISQILSCRGAWKSVRAKLDKSGNQNVTVKCVFSVEFHDHLSLTIILS